MTPIESLDGAEPVRAASSNNNAPLQNPDAWEMIDIGRYRPRRIRGSLRGRELG